MIAEHDEIVLAKDLPEHGLVAGDIGVVVLIHGSGEAYEVEFCTLDGATIALATVKACDLTELSAHRREVPHARALA